MIYVLVGYPVDAPITSPWLSCAQCTTRGLLLANPSGWTLTCVDLWPDELVPKLRAGNEGLDAERA